MISRPALALAFAALLLPDAGASQVASNVDIRRFTTRNGWSSGIQPSMSIG